MKTENNSVLANTHTSKVTLPQRRDCLPRLPEISFTGVHQAYFSLCLKSLKNLLKVCISIPPDVSGKSRNCL